LLATYDGLGSRVSTLESGTLRYYDWDGINVIQEKDGTNAVTERQVHGYAPIPSVGDIALMDKGGTPYVPVADQVGTTWGLLDSNATIASYYEYDAFGVSRGVSESVSNLYRFGTKRLDADPGLYHFIARQYEADLGRFGSRDPLGPYPQHLYEYCRDAPIGRVDPTGLWDKWDVHQDATKMLAHSYCFFELEYARKAGECCRHVDETGFLGLAPIMSRAAQEWHFDMTPSESIDWGPSDTRFNHYLKSFDSAVAEARTNPCDLDKAVCLLGEALHPAQDWFAHGNWYTVYSSAASVLPALAQLLGLPWKRHPPGFDTPGLDYNGPDGVPVIPLAEQVGWVEAEGQYAPTYGSRRILSTHDRTVLIMRAFLEQIGDQARTTLTGSPEMPGGWCSPTYM
jgi:RHS repeat-associated protein